MCCLLRQKRNLRPLYHVRYGIESYFIPQGTGKYGYHAIVIWLIDFAIAQNSYSVAIASLPYEIPKILLHSREVQVRYF